MISKYYRIIGWVLIILFGAKDLITVFLYFQGHPLTVVPSGRREINFTGMFWKMLFSLPFDIFIWAGAILLWRADQTQKAVIPGKGLKVGKSLIVLLSLLALAAMIVFILCLFIMSQSG